jgi:hypothetical protein
MPAKHVPWSEAERTTLREMWADGIGPVEIGRQTQHHRPSRANHAPNRCHAGPVPCRRSRVRRQTIRRSLDTRFTARSGAATNRR